MAAVLRTNSAKIDAMNRMIANAFGFERCYAVSGQTYPRKLDSRILSALSSVAQSAHKFANDLRLLQHDQQVEEPFEKDQIGSSAMAYKRNPMRSERICSLSRYVMANAQNAPMTASTQWFERTLDDSANRRIGVPEAFLCSAGSGLLPQRGLASCKREVIERRWENFLPSSQRKPADGGVIGGAVWPGALHEIHAASHSMAAKRRGVK